MFCDRKFLAENHLYAIAVD